MDIVRYYVVNYAHKREYVTGVWRKLVNAANRLKQGSGDALATLKK